MSNLQEIGYQQTESRQFELFTDVNDSNVERLIDIQLDKVERVECLDNIKFMNSLPSESMNLVVTSPPYNMQRQYENFQNLESYLEGQRKCIAEAIRLLKSDGAICWQVGTYVSNGEVYPLDILLYSIFKELGMKLRNRIVWNFRHGLHCQKRFSGRYETILWFTKSDNYTFNLDPIRVPSKYPNKKHFKGPKKGLNSCNPLGKNPTDVWDIPNVKANHVEKTDHPCQFPVELVERLILALTNENESVLVPYLGSGSTAIASLLHGRKIFGCDTNQHYIDITWRRIKELRMEKSIYVAQLIEQINISYLSIFFLFSDYSYKYPIGLASS